MFYKQIDGCAMGGLLSVTLADIWMTKMEHDIVKPTRPTFYKRYVDDIIYRRKKDKVDELFEALNLYHPKINLTIEIMPEKFLDTRIEISNGEVSTSVYRKDTKLPIPWSSKVPNRYKRNAITSDLNRAKRISSNFQAEKNAIRTKFAKANYPHKFINSVFRQFTSKDEKLDDESLLIPKDFFEEKEEKPFILIEIPYCSGNEKASHAFLTKFHNYTSSKYRVAIKWITKKTKTLFPLKDRNNHPACKIYEGVCSCGSTYIGETKRNCEQRWKEHLPPHKSEPANHIRENHDHKFQWRVIANAPMNNRTRKNLEALYIALKRPNLNEQVESNVLTLFRFGIT